MNLGDLQEELDVQVGWDGVLLHKQEDKGNYCDRRSQWILLRVHFGDKWKTTAEIHQRLLQNMQNMVCRGTRARVQNMHGYAQQYY